MLSFNIRGSGDMPLISGVFGSPWLNRDARGYFFRVERSGFTPGGILDITIPTAQPALTYVLQHKGETYFVAEIPVAILHGSSSPAATVSNIKADGATVILTDDADVISRC